MRLTFHGGAIERELGWSARCVGHGESVDVSRAPDRA